MLVNVYVPNAGGRPERARLDFKCRFLRALQRRCDSLAAAGRQVIIVGDLNIAAGPDDVCPKFSHEAMYHEDEKAALAGLLRDFVDVWRRLHPQETAVYTVWDEKTSARAFNEVLRIVSLRLKVKLLVTPCQCVQHTAALCMPVSNGCGCGWAGGADRLCTGVAQPGGPCCVLRGH